MKEILKKTFDTNVLLVVGVMLGIILTFEFIVFPGLSASDTILNILALLVGGFTILFAFHFIQWKKLFEFLSDNDETTSPDKVVKKTNRKSNPKQFDGVENDKPFVKTRKKTNKK
jgi:hypothetical protein